jgi:PIN domain nuclease of toxin-antitoxin system
VTPTLLLDTHILIWWIGDPRRLSKEQLRVMSVEEKRRRPFGVSAITLIELAHLFATGMAKSSVDSNQILAALETDPAFQVFPITVSIARDFGSILPALRDPADAVITATARVHGLRLVTSDTRILSSNLALTVE